MDKTTHAKISINDATGDAEARVLNVVSDTKPGRRHSLVSIDVSQAVERIDAAELKRALEDAYTGPRDVKIVSRPSPLADAEEASHRVTIAIDRDLADTLLVLHGLAMHEGFDELPEWLVAELERAFPEFAGKNHYRRRIEDDQPPAA